MVLPKYSKGEALLVSQRNMRQEEQLIIEITLQVLKPKPPTSGWNKHRTVKTNFFQIKTNALLLSRYNIRILVKDGNNDLNTPKLCLLAVRVNIAPKSCACSLKIFTTQSCAWLWARPKVIWKSSWNTMQWIMLMYESRKANMTFCLGICHRSLPVIIDQWSCTTVSHFQKSKYFRLMTPSLSWYLSQTCSVETRLSLLWQIVHLGQTIFRIRFWIWNHNINWTCSSGSQDWIHHQSAVLMLFSEV